MRANRGQPLILGVGGTLRKRSTSSQAVERALESASSAGAAVEMLDLEDLDLPLYTPGLSLEDYGPSVTRFTNSFRSADGIIIGTSAYHGSLAGVTKNALDFLEFLSRDPVPYLQGKHVGLIATAAGDMAAVNAINAMIHVAHALRANVIPLVVAIPQAGRLFDEHGRMADAHFARRLDDLGRLIASTAWGQRGAVTALGATA